VADDRADSLRAHVADLERRDEAVAAQIAVIGALAERVATVRGRAVEIRDALDALPAEIAAVEQAQHAARVAVDDAKAELAEAERKREHVERSRRSTAEEKAAARRTAQDAREALADAEHRIERLQGQRTGLIETRQALQAEADGLAVAARDIATALQDAPRVADAGKGDPGSSLAEIDEWGGRTRAALFVARGTLDNERERVVAEANALAEAVLGEQPSGTSVALVRRRLEQALE
jgi:chromosome segregation ATPase